jgi:acyl carrier protein
MPVEKRNPTVDKVTNVIADSLGIELEEVTPDASIVDDLGADSLDIVELCMALEESFNIEIPDDDMERATTPAKIAVMVDKLS